MAVDLSQYQGKYPPAVLSAISAILEQKPDQAAALSKQYGGDLDRWLQGFEGFWTSPENTSGLGGDLSAYQLEANLMGALGYHPNPQATTTGGSQPAEQGIYNAIAPNIATLISGDADRLKQVGDLTNQTNAAYGNLANTLNQAQAHFDGQQYFQQNPNVGQLYSNSNNGSTPGTKSIHTLDGKDVDMTPDQFAEYYHKNWGAQQGLQPTYTSTVLQQQAGNAATAANATIAAAKEAANSQLTALQQSIAGMQQNLQGELATKAQALQTAVGTLNHNLDQLDASQRANLAQQVTAMQKDLETSIAAQKQALAAEVGQLQGNSDAAAAARRTALEQEIAGLNAAQEPLNQARLQGAEALVTAVNLGLEGTKDQLRADAAREGFVGGSTMQDAALARAGIDARQQGAQAVGAAKTANAADTREIGVLGATKGYSIADALAAERQQAANLGATGGAQLSAALAQGTQGLGDFGATGLRTIGDTTAGTRAAIGNNAAGQTYADTTAGAADTRKLQDTLSKGNYDLAATLATQTQGAKNNQASANFSAGQQLFPQSVNAAQALTQLPGAQAATLTSLIPYSTAGTNNSLGLLNWWNSNAQPPNPTATITPPNQTGNQISALGNSLIGGSFNLGKFNWGFPAPTPSTKIIPPTTSSAPGGVNAGGGNLYTSPLT